MGNFVIKIEAEGGHGCQRDVKDGGIVVAGCGVPGCPDCISRMLVALLARWGTNVKSATLTHWPNPDGTPQDITVVDDLVTFERHGSFDIAPHKGESNIPLLPTENVGPAVDWDRAAAGERGDETPGA